MFFCTCTWQDHGILEVILKEQFTARNENLLKTYTQAIQDVDVYYKHTAFSSQDVNWWTGVVRITWIIVMFLPTVWTLILTAPIHCIGSIGEQVMKSYISPNLLRWRNKLIYILDGLKESKFSANVHFWLNYSFKHHAKTVVHKW